MPISASADRDANNNAESIKTFYTPEREDTTVDERGGADQGNGSIEGVEHVGQKDLMGGGEDDDTQPKVFDEGMDDIPLGFESDEVVFQRGPYLYLAPAYKEEFDKNLRGVEEIA